MVNLIFASVWGCYVLRYIGSLRIRKGFGGYVMV